MIGYNRRWTRAVSTRRSLTILLVMIFGFLSLQTMSNIRQSMLKFVPATTLYDDVDLPTSQLREETRTRQNRSTLSDSRIEFLRTLSTENQTQESDATFSIVISRHFISSLPMPTNENTVVALIAMGKSRDCRLAERCIRSIRAGGRFTGYVMLFTDSKGFENYRFTLSWDPRTIVIQGRPEDMSPATESGRTMVETMIYQRFKTLIPKYISLTPEVRNTTEYFLYLDIDNVVAQDLSGFFQDYQAKIQNDLRLNTNSTVDVASGRSSYISFWRERRHFQGGQFLAHRKFGVGCLDAWRTEFDEGKSKKDQPLLMNVHKHYMEYHCCVHELPFGNFDKLNRRKHFQLFTSNVYEAVPEEFPTIVHITGLRPRINSGTSQRDFLQKALRLENVSDTMAGNITWEEVLMPVGPKGHKPRHEPKPNDEEEEANKNPGENVSWGVGQPSEKNGETQNAYPETETTEYPEHNVLDLEGSNATQPPVAPFSGSEFSIVRPTDENTVIALVSMGEGGKSSLIAERCIRTIRASGNFTGYIILFADNKGYETKRKNLAFDTKVIVIRGREEDLKPRAADGTRIKYFGKGIMIFKRFKTLVLRYLDYDSRFDDIRYALYLDIDNIVANRLSDLFDDYAIQMSETLAQQNSTDFSYFSFWRDPGMKKKKFWQGGQIMYDRNRSTGCVDAWRQQMDTMWGPQDQPLLMNVYNNFTHYGCKVFELPNPERHFTLLTSSVIKGRETPLPTLVHITTARAKKFLDSDLQGKFIRQAMRLSNEREMMSNGISWLDVSKPADAMGRNPSPKKKKKKGNW
ncbi:hypothetical protein IV203_026569 [Nitzschia inconspicua]|uniref:Uncharacterized protein n=1 Tax=Nitzschia inconspicua TaxID=303405 RepID=A0A9K3Q028_9STRA|nr:hypothetical protein IV203_026569 [Nitzschia inconspicua]